MPILEPDINASRRAFIACGLAGGVALTLPTPRPTPSSIRDFRFARYAMNGAEVSP